MASPLPKPVESRPEAIVLSCTDMRTVETMERLETALDKPVVASSDQAMLFEALQAIGLETA